MGTVLGVFFILAAAAAGVLVGMQPTVMDGRWIAAKLEKNAQKQGSVIECDRRISVGVKGAEFACTQSRAGASRQIWYRMSRDGKLEQTRASRVKQDRRVEPTEEPGGDGDSAEGGGED